MLKDKALSIREYELMFIIRPDANEEILKGIRTNVENIIANYSGKLNDISEMGKRRLSYPIKRYQEGIYILCKFSGHEETVKELNRSMSINENVFRYLTTCIPA